MLRQMIRPVQLVARRRMNFIQFWGTLPGYEKVFMLTGFWGMGMSVYLMQRGEPEADGEGGVKTTRTLVPSL